MNVPSDSKNSIRRMVLARLALLWTAFLAPLAVSLRLEDGFLLPQLTVIAAGILLFVLVAPGPVLAWGLLPSSLRISLALFTGLGVLSFTFLALRHPLHLPAQPLLFLAGPLLLFLNLDGAVPFRKAAAFLVLSTLGGCLYAAAQTAGFDLPGWNRDFTGRPFATLGNPVYWAGHLVLLIPAAVWLAATSSGGKRTFWTAASAALVLSLMATQTRAAWIALAAQGACAVALSRHRVPALKAVGALGILMLAGVLLVPAWRERGAALFDLGDVGAAGRFRMWKIAWDQFRDAPLLGQGPGGYAARFHEFQAPHLVHNAAWEFWTSFHAHNEWLEFPVERGLLGAAALAAFLAFLVRGLLREGTPRSRMLLGAGTGLGVFALFHFPFSIPPTAFAAAVLFHPSYVEWRGPSGWSGNGRKTAGERGGRFFAVVAAGALLLFYLACWGPSGWLHRAVDLRVGGGSTEALQLLDRAAFPFFNDSRVAMEKARALEALARLEEAEDVLEAHLARRPFDAEAWSDLCRVRGRAGDWKGAREAGRRALAAAPHHEGALNNLATAAFLSGDFGEAARWLDRYVAVLEARGKEIPARRHREAAKRLRRKEKTAPPDFSS